MHGMLCSIWSSMCLPPSAHLIPIFIFRVSLMHHLHPPYWEYHPKTVIRFPMCFIVYNFSICSANNETSYYWVLNPAGTQHLVCFQLTLLFLTSHAWHSHTSHLHSSSFYFGASRRTEFCTEKPVYMKHWHLCVYCYILV